MKSGKVILAADFILIIICLLGVYQINEKPDLPAEVAADNSGLIIKSVNDSSYNYLNGSRILSVNDFRVNNTNTLEFLLDGTRIADSIKVLVNKDGKILNLNLPLVSYYNIGYILIVLITGLLTFVLSLLAYFKSTDKKIAVVFHWLAISTSVILMTSWGNYIIPSLFIGSLTRISLAGAYAFLPILFIHFTLLYPSHNNDFVYNKISLLYSFALLVFALSIFIIVNAFRLKTEEVISDYYSFFNGLRIYLSLLLIAGVTNFVLSYIRSDSETEKKKLKWVLLGLTICPTFYVVLWVIPGIYLSRNIIPEELLIVLIFLVPVTFAISILKYHLLDINFVINRGLVYFLSLGSAILFYLLIVYGFDILLVNFNNSVPSILAASVIALLFNPAKNRIQNFVDKKFFKVDYDFRKAIKEINLLMGQSLMVEKLSDIYVSELDKLIPVSKTAIVIYNNDSESFSLLKGDNFGNQELFEINQITEKGISFKKGLTNKERTEKECEIPNDDTGTLKKIGITAAIPIFISGGKFLGLLLLGDKKSGLRCTPEDMDLLQSINSKFASEWERIELNNKILQEQIQKEKLRELNETKSFFISSVSHEFKTPLTSIKMFSELLKNRKSITDNEQLHYLDIIEGESGRLDRMIENVLNLSRIEKGIKQYNFESISINDLVKNAVTLMEYQLKMEKCEYSVKYLTEDKIIKADYDLMTGVIINLISNAIKYSTSVKRIEIAIEEKEEMIRISVKDWGIGISKEDMDHILDPYYRGNSSNKNKTKGFGIGLALVKNIVNAHNGHLDIESCPGKGSIFSIFFPRVIL
jgi:signal transduction histidine kinase